MQRFWSFLRNVGALLGTIWLIILIAGALPREDFELTAWGECAEFRLPEKVNKNLSLDMGWFMLNARLRSLMEDDSQNGKKKDGKVAFNEKNFATFKAITKLVEKLPNIRSIWQFTVKNTGEKELRDLILEVPFEGTYSISQGSKVHRSGEFEGEVPLETLRCGNTISVTLWTNYHWMATKREIQISHPSGAFQIQYPLKVSGFTGWLAKRGDFSFIMLSGCALLLSLGCIVIFFNLRTTHNSETDNDIDEDDEEKTHEEHEGEETKKK